MEDLYFFCFLNISPSESESESSANIPSVDFFGYWGDFFFLDGEIIGSGFDLISTLLEVVDYFRESNWPKRSSVFCAYCFLGFLLPKIPPSSSSEEL